MSPDARCAPQVLLERNNYRIVQCEKVHYLDAKQFTIEKKTHIDAMGHQNWASLDKSDTEAALAWLVVQTGDRIVEDRELARQREMLDKGNTSEECLRLAGTA